MTSDEIVYRDRLHIIKHFFEHTIKVAELCVKFPRSRTWFYKWYKRYLAYGEEGLRNIDRGFSAMPNQTPVDVEMVILDFVCRFPAYGPQRIADELTQTGTEVKRSAVYNLPRVCSHTRGPHRLEAARSQHQEKAYGIRPDQKRYRDHRFRPGP